MSPNIRVTVQEGVQRIQLHRPEKKNALTFDMYAALADALAEAESEAGIRAVYLTGTEGCFTAGNDVMDFMRAAEGIPHVLRFLTGISQASTPIVAAVGGVAIGIGVTMLLHCDLIYAAESASFRTPFVDLGLVPEAASSLLLPHTMGHQRAAELLLLGETLSARQARDYGLVNAVLPDAELETTAWGIVNKLATRAPAALKATKRLMKRATQSAITEAMAAEGEAFGARLGSPELMEAVQAFVQRRPADFSKFLEE